MYDSCQVRELNTHLMRFRENFLFLAQTFIISVKDMKRFDNLAKGGK